MVTGRRELTWLACDALALEGRKPSIASVREWTIVHHGRKQGSDTDTQADINAWYQVLLALKQESLAVVGLPEEIAALARQLWVKATEAATNNLATQSAALDAKLVAAHLAVTNAEHATNTALGRVDAVSHEFEVARESIRRLEEALSVARSSLQASEVRHASIVQLRDESLATITRDVATKEALHAARSAELDGLRKHALLQIEQARAESRDWKSACEAATASAALASTMQQTELARERLKVATTQAELANASGRLSAIEEALLASQERVVSLEQVVLKTQERTTAKATNTAHRKSGVVRAAKATLFKQRRRS